MPAKNPQSGKWVYRAVIIAGAVLLALTAIALFPWISHDANYVSQLQQRVTAELPAGSTDVLVDQWLRSNNKYVPTKQIPPRIDTVNGRDVIDLAGMPRRQVSSVLRTTVPRQDVVSRFTNDYVRIYFFFDEHGRLIGNYFLSWSDIVRMESDAG